MANRNQWNDIPRKEPYLMPVNGIVQPPVIPPPNRPGRMTNVLEWLKSVLNATSRKRWAIHFRKPVDSKALGVPDYHTLIKWPMDLSTIRKRLANKYYCQGSEAIEDFTLIYENCMRFNKEGTVVHQAGEELKAYFLKRLGEIDLTNEVELEEKPKPQPKPRARPQPKPKAKPKPNAIKRNQASEETPPASPPIDLHQPRSKRVCPGIQFNQNQSGLRTANVPEILPESPPPPPMPKPVPPLICYKDLDKSIDRNHCLMILKIMRKKKRLHITWPFRSAEKWASFSENKDYDHSPEGRLDWPILESHVNSDDFEGFDDFVALVRQMFQNGLRCFPYECLTRLSILETIEIFDATLARFEKLVKDKKDLSRVWVAEELQKMEDEAAAEGSNEYPWKRLVLASRAKKAAEAAAQAAKKAAAAKPPPPLICYKDLDRSIELNYCKVLLKVMRKQKRRHFTWPFNRADCWMMYSTANEYDDNPEKRLDWPTLEDRLNTGNFESLDSFVALVHQMFQNGLRCFPVEGLIKGNIMETISVFDTTLIRFRKLVQEKKDLSRVWVAEEVEKNGGVPPQKARRSIPNIQGDIIKNNQKNDQKNIKEQDVSYSETDDE